MSTSRKAEEMLRRVEAIRIGSLRKLLMLYLNSRARFIEWSLPEELGGKKPKGTRRYPGLKLVMKYLGCSKATARDYQAALTLIEEFSHIGV